MSIASVLTYSILAHSVLTHSRPAHSVLTHSVLTHSLSTHSALIHSVSNNSVWIWLCVATYIGSLSGENFNYFQKALYKSKGDGPYLSLSYLYITYRWTVPFGRSIHSVVASPSSSCQGRLWPKTPTSFPRKSLRSTRRRRLRRRGRWQGGRRMRGCPWTVSWAGRRSSPGWTSATDWGGGRYCTRGARRSPTMHSSSEC